jgi:DNA-binding transcriptional ArsR family regulator
MILEQVASGGGLTATQLASGLPITRQAVAKHLAVLQEAGLVDGRRAGRELRYVGARWDDRLAALERAARRRARAAPTPPAAS